jgi:hypothetical protein
MPGLMILITSAGFVLSIVAGRALDLFRPRRNLPAPWPWNRGTQPRGGSYLKGWYSAFGYYFRFGRLKTKSRQCSESSGPSMSTGFCPFYGYRWPEQTFSLVEVGGGECGLDFDRKGRCLMAQWGDVPNFRCCPTASRAEQFLLLIGPKIHFVPQEVLDARPS